MSDLKDTVFLYKEHGKLAIIGFALARDGGIVFKQDLTDWGTEDYGNDSFSSAIFPTAKETWAKFEEAIKTSEDRGWIVGKRGEPNGG